MFVKMDEREFEAIIRQYHATLHDYVSRRTGSSDIADDILQNVFVRLWQSRNSVRVKGSIKSYLFTAARNAVIDAGKSEDSRRERELLSAAERFSAEGEYDDALERDNLVEMVQRVVDTLPPACREVFELHRVYDLSYPEIADTLGVSLSTVKTQMSRAFAVLNRELRPLVD